jgi:hypothetical protein
MWLTKDELSWGREVSEDTNVWYEAILAGSRMALGPRLGEEAFADLLLKHPEDGIVFYERGEAFEYLGDFQRARQDYERAGQLLPMRHWRTIAGMAIQRLTDPDSFKTAPAQWVAFHTVHSTPEAPHELRRRALSALERIDSDWEAVVDLRKCLGEMVRDLYRTFAPNTRQPRRLETRIYELRRLGVVPEDVASDMQRLRDLGNKGAHSSNTLQPERVNQAIDSFIEVLHWCSIKMWESKSRR